MVKTSKICPHCRVENAIELKTYKRLWRLCRDCGTGWPEQRPRYPLAFTNYQDLGKNADSAQSMYDYFTTPVHIEHAVQEAEQFYHRYLEELNVDFHQKSILDVSGGNGFFVKWFQERFSARASLTEYNQKTVAFALEQKDLEICVQYDMNKDRLLGRTNRKFDIVIAKACIMFCENIQDFAKQLHEVLNPGGVLILAHSVEPTLGTIVRVQLDEFSYFALRQPNVVEASFLQGGFSLEHRTDETDPDLYVYDHDLLPHWMALHYYYEIRNARILASERLFHFPARDRRRSTFVFRRNDP